MSKIEWFGEWFDSPYYHILYQNRDHEEAQFFIDRLIAHLAPDQEARFLDLACGKGRHAIYLNSKGYDVTGLDLSEQNIRYASRYSNERLHFEQQDMREPFGEARYDYVLNLFTSFGYFDTKSENQQAINCIANSLRKGGTFVLDFLNPYAVINGLVSEEEKTMGGITFKISRSFDGEYILKDIEFFADGSHYHYQEKVKAIRRVKFLSYFEQAGLQVREVFGNYQLSSYDKEKSERLIFIATK
ncbi:class I SAM-dependent methyltransferase [Marinoscillum furvescens]|uniref:2-polyprenyl-3-methyl-5-hydroxy-6-metoxy-1, 4-benzoquinol methylase n=1 Tax=Marinoscillum furvescens DSM 4134 TaxID=1122208 RepID=A0A3D9LH12_MARFU|nr:class I SAM-dependent methyltransferase [Marinoscillum furvescens]REE05927.1 2-polyprenyl-3-methyl-5-hydroxy-6-metoxy-1,4-benzoquinol methylase [Marinoscillum furvescens DSM 4134]